MPTSRTPRVQIVANRGTLDRHPEVWTEQGFLCVNVEAPEIPQNKFRYSISKRYLLVWADGSSHARHRFVILPHPVEPHDHRVVFTNGVVDARIRIRT